MRYEFFEITPSPVDGADVTDVHFPETQAIPLTMSTNNWWMRRSLVISG